jgi:hypothetical protein
MATEPSSDKLKASRPKKQPDNYDKPELRQSLKEQITAGAKGSKPGQWSARKAQLLTHDDERAGGGYLRDQRTPEQQHSSGWTDEAWQTSDGKPAEREGGTTRYLPKAAWDELSPAEKKATNAKKTDGFQSRPTVGGQYPKGESGSPKSPTLTLYNIGTLVPVALLIYPELIYKNAGYRV